MRNVTRGVALVFVLMLAASCEKEGPTAPAAPAIASPASVSFVEIVGVANFFQAGQTEQFRAMATLSNGFVEDRTSSATWASDNAGVASVNAQGVVTAGGEGEASISATVGGQRGTRNVRVRYGFRTPDPPPGQRLPAPNAFDVVVHVFQTRPDLVARSCQDAGGTWEFMDEVVDQLRLRDLRWGYNGRRGDPGFPGRDEVAYHYGAGPSEGSRDTYAWDIMVGHCGSNPQPAWQDVTGLGTIWLSRGRF